MSAPLPTSSEAAVCLSKSQIWDLLRHTFLSLAAEQGVHPSVMQKLAGHSSPEITMKIYTHVNVEAKKAAMEAMQNAYMKREQKAS